jgi:RNA polymerase sigma-70 factor (ECF subfamily)
MALRHDEVEQVDRFAEGRLHATTPSRDGTVDVTRDKVLVERCQAGDRQAFDELYLRYQRRLHRFCMQRLGEAHDAEDIVQEAFVRAWRALPRFAGERRFYPWLTVIAANLCVDTMRRRARLIPVEESRITASDTGTYDIEDAVLHEVDSKMVATAFGQLSSRHQRILQLREGSDWSYRKIAEHEGVGVTAVETLLWRARQALKREFLMLDEKSSKVGALIGFLMVLPARMVAGLPKAARHAANGFTHAASGAKHAIGSLGSGLSEFGTSGAFGIFGPSVAAATGAVALSVGTVLMLPVAGAVGGTSTGSPSPVPVATVAPTLATPVASGTNTGAGTNRSAGGPGTASGSPGASGPTAGGGNGPAGGILGSGAASGDGSAALGTIGSAVVGPAVGPAEQLGSAANPTINAVGPSLAPAVSAPENQPSAVGSSTSSAISGVAGSAAGASVGSAVGGATSSGSSAVNGATSTLGLPLNLGS